MGICLPKWQFENSDWETDREKSIPPTWNMNRMSVQSVAGHHCTVWNLEVSLFLHSLVFIVDFLFQSNIKGSYRLNYPWFYATFSTKITIFEFTLRRLYQWDTPSELGCEFLWPLLLPLWSQWWLLKYEFLLIFISLVELPECDRSHCWCCSFRPRTVFGILNIIYQRKFNVFIQN